MQSAVQLEDSLEDEVDISNEVYKGSRFSAAKQFAKEVVRENQKIINKGAGYYLCYLTAINSFAYSFFKLKFSKTDNAYIFQDRFPLKIVG